MATTTPTTTTATEQAIQTLPGNFQKYYQTVYNQLKSDAPNISYNMEPEAKLRASLRESLRPAYDAAIRNRQKQTAASRASIDADAAARGIGSSTWVTDAKMRQADAEAADIASLESNYASALASQLASRWAAEKANKLAADQTNASLNSSMLSQALSTTQSMYDKWLQEEKRANAGSGGGSGGGGGGYASTPATSSTKKKSSSGSNTTSKDEELAALAYEYKLSRPYVTLDDKKLSNYLSNSGITGKDATTFKAYLKNAGTEYGYSESKEKGVNNTSSNGAGAPMKSSQKTIRNTKAIATYK